MVSEKALKILVKCEADLRALVASAAGDGNYDEVMRITSWAKQISGMSAGWGASAPAPVKGKKSLSNHSTPRVSVAYPRFLRRGDQLVKIGWSKSAHSEYEHKSPRSALTSLAKAAMEAGKDGRIFQVTALKDLADSTQIADYQIYLAVAWWRALGILDQHGRQGYSLAKSNHLLEAVESAWTKLARE